MSNFQYIQIAERLMDMRRALKAPVRLPDEHTLALKHHVSRDTVRKALRVLEEQEAVVRRPRRGTFLQPLTPTVSTLRGQVIGFVPPWWADSTTAWHTSTVFEGVSRWAHEQGCHINVLHAQNKPIDDDQWLEQVRQLRLAGLIWLNPQSQQMPLVRRAAKVFPVVVAGRCESGEGLYSVSPDWEQAAQLLDQRLVSAGHRSYVVVGTDMMGSYSQTWIEAIAKLHARRGVPFDHTTQFVDLRPFDRSLLPTLLLDLLRSDPIYSGAFLLTSSSYLQYLTPDTRFRERIGREVSVVSIDFGIYPMESYWPGFQFDHVACDWTQVGWQAANRLAQIVSGQDVPRTQILPVRFQPGQSCVTPQAPEPSAPDGSSSSPIRPEVNHANARS